MKTVKNETKLKDDKVNKTRKEKYFLKTLDVKVIEDISFEQKRFNRLK